MAGKDDVNAGPSGNGWLSTQGMAFDAVGNGNAQ